MSRQQESHILIVPQCFFGRTAKFSKGSRGQPAFFPLHKISSKIKNFS